MAWHNATLGMDSRLRGNDDSLSKLNGNGTSKDAILNVLGRRPESHFMFFCPKSELFTSRETSLCCY